MAVESIAWSPTSIRLNRTNNYQDVSTYTVTFDGNFSGEFTVEIYVSGVNTITLTRYGNGTDTYTEEFLVRAEDWFTTYNYYSDNESLVIRIGGVVASRGISVTLENAPPVVDSLTIRSSWSDPTVFVQGVTSITITAQISPLFGAEIDSAEVELLGLTNYIEMENVGGVWTATIPSSSVSDSGSFTPLIKTIDSRGLRGQNSFTQNRIKVLEHSEPTVSVEAFRCDSNGDFDLGGGYISVTAWANSNPSILGLEYLHIYLQNLDATQTWTEYNAQSGTTYILGADEVDPDEGYILQVTAEDNYDLSTMIPYGISAVNRIINVKDGGTGIAFGKLATEDALLDSAWAIKGMSSVTVQTEPGTDATQPSYVILDHTGSVAGVMRMTTSTYGDNKYPRRYIFQQYALDSSTAERLPYKDVFRLPAGEFDLTADGTYEIITTKNLADIGTMPVAQGGTGATDANDARVNLGLKIAYSAVTNGGTTRYTISPNSRHFVLVIGSGVTNNYAVFLFACTSTGSATQRQVAKGSGVTVSTSGTTISITSSGAAATVMDWAISGDNLEVQA